MDSSRQAPYWRDVALLALGALLYRVALLVLMPRVLDSADSIHYIGVAKQFASGNFFDFFHEIPPLYPALGAFLYLFMGDFEWALALVSLLCSVATLVPVYFLALRLFDRSTAVVAALIVLLWPWHADYAWRVGNDAAGCCFWMFGVWLFAEAMRKGGWWIPASVAAFFALHLTRPEGTFLLLAAPIVGGLLLCTGAGGGKGRRLIPFVVLAAILLTCYGFYMLKVTGSFAINPRLRLLFEARGEETIPHFFVPFEATSASPFAEIAKTFIKLFAEVPVIMLGPILTLFAGVGFFHKGAKPRDLRLEFFVLIFALLQWGLVVVSHSPAPRYLMSSLIVVSMWSARGLTVVAAQGAALPRHKWLRHLPVASMALYMLFGMTVLVGREHMGGRPSQPYEYKQAGRWMRENLEPGLIIARKSQVGYYADMKSIGPEGTDSLEDILAKAKHGKARYLVVDERYGVQMVPALKALLDVENAPPGLTHLKTFTPNYRASRVVIYAFDVP